MRIDTGIYWSILNVVICPETGCMNGYAKKTNYTKQLDNEVIVDSVRNKVKLQFLDCIPKRKVVFHIPTFILGQLILP